MALPLRRAAVPPLPTHGLAGFLPKPGSASVEINVISRTIDIVQLLLWRPNHHGSNGSMVMLARRTRTDRRRPVIGTFVSLAVILPGASVFLGTNASFSMMRRVLVVTELQLVNLAAVHTTKKPQALESLVALSDWIQRLTGFSSGCRARRRSRLTCKVKRISRSGDGRGRQWRLQPLGLTLLISTRSFLCCWNCQTCRLSFLRTVP